MYIAKVDGYELHAASHSSGGCFGHCLCLHSIGKDFFPCRRYEIKRIWSFGVCIVLRLSLLHFLAFLEIPDKSKTLIVVCCCHFVLYAFFISLFYPLFSSLPSFLSKGFLQILSFSFWISFPSFCFFFEFYRITMKYHYTTVLINCNKLDSIVDFLNTMRLPNKLELNCLNLKESFCKWFRRPLTPWPSSWLLLVRTALTPWPMNGSDAVHLSYQFLIREMNSNRLERTHDWGGVRRSTGVRWNGILPPDREHNICNSDKGLYTKILILPISMP